MEDLIECKKCGCLPELLKAKFSYSFGRTKAFEPLILCVCGNSLKGKIPDSIGDISKVEAEIVKEWNKENIKRKEK